jgi:outer membrane lipoprotein-sorting protein
MKSGMVATAILAAAVTVLCFGQVPDDARDLLKRVAETYRNLDSFEWTAIATVTTDSGDFRPRPVTVVGEFRRPRQMRVEFPNRATMPLIAVTDGQTAVELYPSRRGFCRPDPKLFLQRTALHDAMSALAWSLPYEHIMDGLKSARIVGNRELKIGGEVVKCQVVRAIYAPATSGRTGTVQTAPITYWIDLKTNIVVQQSFPTTIAIPGRHRPRTDTTTTTLVRYRLDPKIQEARFTFRPPVGVREQSCLSFSSGG